MIEARGHKYPKQRLTVCEFPQALHELFPRPEGFSEDWPPAQLLYLHDYLANLGCKTLVHESHYIDRDHIDDTAFFYARNLRGYPNYCQRLHFFGVRFDQQRFRGLMHDANAGRRSESESFLQSEYLGFAVVRPLPGSPIGRSVLKTYPSQADAGHTRNFSAVRKYNVHLAAFDLSVEGLAFQQQDRGVSACATTALWSALHRIADDERMQIPTPAEITESASRYFLPEGRSVPSEGLTVHQISEAGRAAGFAPLLVRSVSPEHDRVQLLGYLASGFAPVIAIRPFKGDQGHAVCGVGVKLGAVKPQTDPNLGFRDRATAVTGVYVHDDRLGPYACANLFNQTVALPGGGNKVMTALSIAWPERHGGKAEYEFSFLQGIIVPLPRKVRLSLTQLWTLGLSIAQWVSQSIFPSLKGQVVLSCRYRLAVKYRRDGYSFGLTRRGAVALASELVLSRYLGMIELTVGDTPLLDVLIDSTETDPNSSVLAVVRRAAFPRGEEKQLKLIAARVGARVVVT